MRSSSEVHAKIRTRLTRPMDREAANREIEKKPLHAKLASLALQTQEYQTQIQIQQKNVLLTGVDLDENTHVDFANTANTRAFMRFISWITKQCKDHKFIYIFLNNVRYHSPTDNLKSKTSSPFGYSAIPQSATLLNNFIDLLNVSLSSTSSLV